MKKASSRSQRGSKGIKGKHVLQICVLLGVCIWLIYQVKYSHDKKKEFYEKDGKKSTVLSSENGDGLVKLGRKDLLPGYHNEKHVEEDEEEEEVSHGEEEKERKSKAEEEEEEVVEEDENKQGEEVVEEDEEESKHEEDEIDEQDQSKTGGEDDELLEEEKEKETEADMTVDEAREEHYKADDASSAVSHESRLLSTEKLNENSGNSTETATSEVKIQKEPVLKLGEAKSGDFVNTTATKANDDGNSETKSAVTESIGETVNGNSTVAAVLEASGFLQNETKIMRDRSQEDGAPSARSSDPNITVSSANITNNDSIQDEFKNSTSESSLIENISSSNTIPEEKENSGYEGDDESGQQKESSNLYSTEQTEEADDTSETSISQEEREALIDTQTLPDIRIEGNEDEAIGAE